MTKVIKPIKEFWESDKKPDFLTLSKTKNGSNGVIKFNRPKAKRKNKKSGLKEL